jgi:hypothetical protein
MACGVMDREGLPEWQLGMAKRVPTKRRAERREIHIDRRKTLIDVLERIMRGVRGNDLRESTDDRPSRSRTPR